MSLFYEKQVQISFLHIWFSNNQTVVWLDLFHAFPFYSMLKTLERYQKCSYGAEEVNKPAKELEVSLVVFFYSNVDDYSVMQFLDEV